MAATRVLHFAEGMDRAGVETMIMNLYRRLDRERVQFDFLYFTDKRCDYDAEIELLGGRIYRLFPSTNPVNRLRATRKFLSAHRHSFVAVHVHAMFFGGVYLLAARLAGIDTRIAHAHATSASLTLSSRGRAYQWLSIMLMRGNATQYVACGIAAGKFLFGRRSKFTLLPNGIDLDRFLLDRSAQRDWLTQLLALKGGSTILLQVGRLDHQKNPGFTIEVAAALQQLDVDFHLVFIGEGKLEDSLRKSIMERKLQNSVTLLGVRDDIAAFMAGADVLLLPSHYEGFPLVLVESQAAGIMALVSDKISPEVDLGVGEVQFLDTASPHQWASTIAQGRKVPSILALKRCNIIGNKGYDAKNNVERLLQIYGVSMPPSLKTGSR